MDVIEGQSSCKRTKTNFYYWSSSDGVKHPAYPVKYEDSLMKKTDACLNKDLIDRIEEARRKFHSYQFKPSYGNKMPRIYEEELKKLTAVALAHYNARHKRRFVLVEPLHLNCVTGLMDFIPGYDHLSFIAKTVDPPHQLKLFFAEIHSDETEETYIPYVKCCTPVEPGTPFFPLGCGSCHPHGVIYHPFGCYNVGGSVEDTFPPYPSLNPAEESAKKLLRDKYIFKFSNEDLPPDEDKDFRETIDFYARKALNRYHIGLDCAFEYIKLIQAVCFSDPEAQCMEDAKAWVHMTFLANDTLATSPRDSRVLFFAEYSIDCDLVTTCCIIPKTNSGLKVVTSCMICGEACPMFHPDSEYYAGIDGGTFIDALNEQRSWGKRVYLEEKQPLVATQPGL